MAETPAYNRTGRQHAAYAGLRASGVTVMFDNLMDGTACVTGNAPWRWDDIITDLGMRLADLAHAGPDFLVIRTVADIDEAYRSGRTGLVFGSAGEDGVFARTLDGQGVLVAPAALREAAQHLRVK